MKKYIINEEQIDDIFKYLKERRTHKVKEILNKLEKLEEKKDERS